MHKKRKQTKNSIRTKQLLLQQVQPLLQTLKGVIFSSFFFFFLTIWLAAPQTNTHIHEAAEQLVSGSLATYQLCLVVWRDSSVTMFESSSSSSSEACHQGFSPGILVPPLLGQLIVSANKETVKQMRFKLSQGARTAQSVLSWARCPVMQHCGFDPPLSIR